MVFKISILESSITLRLDTASNSLYSSDGEGVIASRLFDMVKSEEGSFGIQGTSLSTGTDILSDPWSFFLWLKRRQFNPKWVGAPPKVPKAPKGAII